MHVSVLPAIRGQNAQSLIAFISVSTRFFIPEVALHEIPDLTYCLLFFINTRQYEACGCQHDKSMTVSHCATVGNFTVFNDPCIVTLSLLMHSFDELHTIFCPAQLLFIIVKSGSGGVIEYKSSGADQMAHTSVINCSVIQEALVKSAI